MAEPTNELDAWSQTVAEKLRVREADYLRIQAAIRTAEDDPDQLERELKWTAGAALGELVLALRQLPAFSRLEGLAPLADIVGAIGDLAEGGRPILLRPSGNGKGIDGNRRQFVKLQAVVMAEMLVKLGVAIMEACGVVADELTRAGFTGRQRGSVSPKTVFEWCGRLSDAQRREAAMELAGIEEGPLWPFSHETARQFVRWRFSHPMVRSKI